VISLRGNFKKRKLRRSRAFSLINVVWLERFGVIGRH
jgi:hypothetical protein